MKAKIRELMVTQPEHRAFWERQIEMVPGSDVLPLGPVRLFQPPLVASSTCLPVAVANGCSKEIAAKG